MGARAWSPVGTIAVARKGDRTWMSRYPMDGCKKNLAVRRVLPAASTLDRGDDGQFRVFGVNWI
jgi:hypothetical protein